MNEIFCDICHTQLEKIKKCNKVTGFYCPDCKREWKIVCIDSGNCPEL